MEIFTRLISRRPTASAFLSSAYDPALEREFFARVILSNGSVKTTYEHRLDDLNELVLPYIRELSRPVQILDVAASSGVSSAEWYEQLAAQGIPCSLTATDLSVNAFHVCTGAVEAVLDKELQVIHIGIGGLGIRPRSNHNPIHNLVTNTAKAYIRWKLQQGLKYEPMRLISKRFSESPNLQMIEGDLLAKTNPAMQRRFDVIRAANVLNLAYFPENVLSSMIANLKAHLLDGGLFIVCRTDLDAANSATLFRLKNFRFTVLSRIGIGSEVEALVRAQ